MIKEDDSTVKPNDDDDINNNDHSGNGETSDVEIGDQHRLVHYHVDHFVQMIATVMNKDRHLFTPDEMRHIGTFLHTMNEQCQRIFVRVYNRSALWFHEADIDAKYAQECALSEQFPSKSYSQHAQIGAELLSSLGDGNDSYSKDDDDDDDVILLVSDSDKVLAKKPSPHNVSKYIDVLLQHGFLEEFSADRHDLRELLNTLTLQQLKLMNMRLFNMRSPSEKKATLIARIVDTEKSLKVDQQSKLSLFFSSSSGNVMSKEEYDLSHKVKVMGHIRALAGRVLRVSEQSADIFRRRINTLCFLGQNMDSKSMILETIQVVKFPKYQHQTSSLFHTRNDFEKYIVALDLEQQLTSIATEKEKINMDLLGQVAQGLARETARYHAEQSPSCQDSADDSNSQTTSPSPRNYYLLRFTAGWVYARALSLGVEILEKTKMYEQAVLYLRLLLDSPYRKGKRGNWYNRLCLDLQHNNQNTLALEVCMAALDDLELRTHDRITLEKRRNLLQQKCRIVTTSLCETDLTLTLLSAKHVHIRGKYEHTYIGKSSHKSRFLSYDGSTVVTVEELALEYYASKYGLKGIHSEGSIFSCLFSLIMYDIIFDDTIPHVFQNRFQNCPLDLNTDAFYLSRKEKIDERVESIAKSIDHALQLLEASFEEHFGEQIMGVDWERFSDLQQLQCIVKNLGGNVLSGVLRMLAEDFRNLRAGMPDLLLYGERFEGSIICEVKGPRDRLSDKQLAWIDALCRLGARVEVCHVHEHNTKQKKKPKTIHFDDNEIFEVGSL